MKPVITSAFPGDLPDIAALHVKAWQETYVGLVPQEYLDGLDVKDRLAKWEEGYKLVQEEKQVLLMAHVSEEPAGFISAGPARDEAYKDYGEIYAVYLLKKFWHKGIGYKLFITAGEWLVAHKLAKAYMWVLDTNLNAIESYERWGGRLEKDRLKHHEIGGHPIKEVQVVFDKL